MKGMLITGLLLLTAAAWAIPGDLNLDGKVDFDDFFFFADQFGKEGPPDTLRVVVMDTVTVVEPVVVVDTARVTVYDTIPVVLRDTITQVIRDTVTVRQVDTTVTYISTIYREPPYVAPPPDLSGTIEDVVSVVIQGIVWNEDWDADIEEDGPEIDYRFKNPDNVNIYSWEQQEDTYYSANVRFFIAIKKEQGEQPTHKKKYDTPIFEGNFILRQYTPIRVPFEAFDPVPDEDVRNNYDSWNYFLSGLSDDVKVAELILEVRITFSDGAQFAYRDYTLWQVKKIDGQYRLHYEGDPAD